MPAIWNLGNINQANDKKISSKLTFEVGESFKGKIVSEGDGNEVVVKLSDGWQFSAELTGEGFVQEGKVVQFQVEGFEDGKVKLKILDGAQGKENTSSKDIVGDFLSKEGMPKADTDILKAMIKHNIPLTKENIAFVKSIITFNGKMNNNSDEIDEFINKFIAGKSIDPKGNEAQSIKVKLNDFFNSFKTMGEKDILLFMENDIEFTKENIDSYNKMFKENGNMKEYFDNVSKELKSLELPKVKEIEPSENVSAKQIGADNEKTLSSPNAALKAYDLNVPTKEKMSMLSLIKSISGSDMELVKDSLKDIIKENKDTFNSSEIKTMSVKLESMNDDDIVKDIKKFINSEGINKNTIDKAISSILGKEVKLSEGSSQKVIDILNIKLNENATSINDENISNNNINPEKALDNNTNPGKTLESEVVKTQGGIADKSNQDIFNGEKLNQEVKTNQEVQTKNNEPGNLNVADKKAILSEEVNGKNVEISLKASSAETIKNDINGKIQNMKDIIKDIISRTSIKGEGMEKVIDFIKSNINDFKVFNSISNEYYYLDLPVNKLGKEYPCKLIIKDNRKDNKKIDRTNVKVVVAVKTANIGTVDGYLTVNNSNLTINLKCEEKFVKPLDFGKDKLIKPLHDMGFLVNISVEKKFEEVNLTSCREFFSDSNQNSIDIKV